MKVSKKILATLSIAVAVGSVVATTTSCSSAVKAKVSKTIGREGPPPGFDCPGCGMG
jgi:hypothetical protein